MSRLLPGVRGLLPAALALLCLLPFVPAAHAGEYSVFACRDGAGRAIPLGDWKPEAYVLGPGDDHCADQGFFYATLGTAQTGVDWWTGIGVTLPEGLRATAFAGDRWARLDSPDAPDTNASPAYSLRWGSGTRWFDTGTKAAESCDLSTGCAVVQWPDFPSGSAPAVSAVFPGGATFVGFALACVQHGPTGGACRTGVTGRGHLRVNRFELVVRDDAAPVVAGPAAGGLTRSGSRSGLQTLTFPASDVGSGIHQARLEVDGQEVARISPDPSPSCVDDGGLPDTLEDFTRLQPCRRSVDVSFALDTASFANGPHRVTASLRDASGNWSGPVTIDADFQNVATLGMGPNGSGGTLGTASLGRKGERRTLRTGYGTSPAIVGTLLDAANTPIGGAVIDVSEQVDVPAAPWAAAGTVTTDAKGKYRYEPKTTASRRVRFSYAPALGSTAYLTHREVRVAVRAGMTIRAASAVVARRGLIKLDGRVRLEAIPKKGAWVEVQWLKGKSWRTIGTRRVGARGAWAFRHRLTVLANARLQFRARLRPASDVPSEETVSRRVAVRVR